MQCQLTANVGGRLGEIPNLFVTGSSTFPTMSRFNLTLTIQAGKLLLSEASRPPRASIWSLPKTHKKPARRIGGGGWLLRWMSSGMAEEQDRTCADALLRVPSRLVLFQIFARWIIARERRLPDKLGWVVGPKLAHLRIGLQDGVHELSIHARHFSDVDIEDRRSVFVNP